MRNLDLGMGEGGEGRGGKMKEEGWNRFFEEDGKVGMEGVV